MANTLGLDDDLDSVEIVRSIESAFDIKIANEEAAAIVTVGDMFNLLREKIAGNAGRKCASAMAFYRLRRALAAHHTEAKLTSETELSWLRDIYTKEVVRALELKAGLRLPKPGHTWIGHIGVTIAALGIFGAFAAVFLALIMLFFVHWNSNALAGIASPLLVGGLILGALLGYLDPGRLPKQYATLGDLAKSTSNLSYGILVTQGADASESRIWNVLTEMLSGFTAVPAGTIHRDTHFLASAFKKANAA